MCTGTAHTHVVYCDKRGYITFGDHLLVQIASYFKQGDWVKEKSNSNDEVQYSVPNVNWSSASDAQILDYTKLTNTLMGHIDINRDAFTCCELKCNNVAHQHARGVRM